MEPWQERRLSRWRRSSLAVRPSRQVRGGGPDLQLCVAGESFDDYRPPVWDGLQRIVGYPVSYANQEQAFLEASRSPLDRIYDEYNAAKRQLDRG